MAVKIIKPGRTKKHDPIYFKCENCGCIFTADDKDDYEIEFTLRNEFDLKIDCPCCGERYTRRKLCTKTLCTLTRGLPMLKMVKYTSDSRILTRVKTEHMKLPSRRLILDSIRSRYHITNVIPGYTQTNRLYTDKPVIYNRYGKTFDLCSVEVLSIKDPVCFIDKRIKPSRISRSLPGRLLIFS